jgi:phosphopantetheinyl transferase
MGRIAAKDAVRCDLWANGAGDVYPAEVRIVGDGGPPRARGWSGRDIGEFDVSIAHCAEVAVAIARRAEPGADRSGPGVGIDVEEIRPHLESTVALALTDAERRLLDERGAGAGTPVETWFVRFWAAKEAVAKAEGTGLEGRPKRFVVTEATENSMTVRVGERTYPVWHREFANPEDLPPRRYVAAWTWAPLGARGDGGTADER